jgi:hypothetical protein
MSWPPFEAAIWCNKLEQMRKLPWMAGSRPAME